ncbi:MAG: DUF192 domain-containing protein [bacterium]
MQRFVSNLILGLFVLALVVVYGVSKQPAVLSVSPLGRSKTGQPTASGNSDTRQIKLPNGAQLVVAVADNDQELQQGLSGVDQLSTSSGMLLVFPQSDRQSIWMKGMKLSLDLVWLDDEGRVVQVVSDAPAPLDDTGTMPAYLSDQPARYVLELASGTAEAAGLKVGAKVYL